MTLTIPSKTISSSLTHEVRLTPTATLCLDKIEESKTAPHLTGLQQIFAKDWREGWFHLAADKMTFDHELSLRFWQDIAKEYLTRLCHLPEEENFAPLEAPAPDHLSQWLLKAPPMNGGEYLSLSRLRLLWEQLNCWVEQASRASGGIHLFLQHRAPKWQQVGRVCFHLAENKKHSDRPFAFLATYATGFGSAGRLKHLPLKKALEQYSGENNHQALVKLLTPVQNAAERCPWVKNLVHTGGLYQPLAWSANKAYQFLTTVPQLEESGLSVRIPNWWKRRSRPQVAVTVGSHTQPTLGLNTMLDFNVEVALGDQNLSPEELEELCSTSEGIVYIRGQWVEVDSEKLRQALEHWKEVQEQAKNGEISFIDGMRLLAGAPSSLQQEEELESQNSWVKVSAGETLSELLQQLKDPSQLPTEEILETLNVTFRAYQQEGIKWMSLLSGLGLGACLADDMGLGKTLQVLALLVIEKKRNAEKRKYPSLLVIPASLLGNWRREAQRFTPSLKLLFVHPSETDSQTLLKLPTQFEHHLKGIDLVITTYSMVIRQDWLSKVDWNLLILDEAQAIKNSSAKQSRAVRNLKSRARIAMTGTPIENRLLDLWSLFDFLNPGLLGSSSRFKEYIKQLQTGSGQFEPLKKLVSPYILRRMKTDPKIISDLPEKIETPTYCQLTKQQAQYYQSTVNDLKKSLEIADSKNRRGIVLQVLLRLKQICNHPCQFSGVGEYHPSQSGKFMRLIQICEELASRQEKVLIFTQFSAIIEPLAECLSGVFGRSGLILHGKTPVKKRKELVETFQNENGPPFFVLSLKAGGTGLTLTAASHVIHIDRWWNPAVENQATDRAFRIGQKKNVQVHKFITQGTIEEEIDKIISSKKKLASDVLGTSDEIKITELANEELLNLVALDIDRSTIT
ncbi:MAG: RNA polymerase-associated protein RapA [Chlamydiae bacterium]|nr:RNA polymerase-associated protein RapA [Chlamydiota bacterium]